MSSNGMTTSHNSDSDQPNLILEAQPQLTPSLTLKKRRLSRKEQKILSKQKKKKVEASTDVKSSIASRANTTNTENTPATSSSSSSSTSTTTTKRHEDFLSKYEPIIFDAGTSKEKSVTAKVSSLGKWFPKAIQLKRSLENGSTLNHRKSAILLFYQYINPLWSHQRLEQVQNYLIRIGQQRVNVAGRIRIANEGLNATISAIDDANGTIDAETTLHYFVQDLYEIDDVFRTQTDFKYITSLSGDRHFHSYHIIPVQELVYYGFNSHGPAPATTAAAINSALPISGARHVPPEVFHRLLAGEDVPVDGALPNVDIDPDTTNQKLDVSSTKKKDIVVIDVRNHYEAALGRFDGQEFASLDTTNSSSPIADTGTHISDSNVASRVSKATSVAKYIDPKMRKSTDFPTWVQKNASDLIQKDRILLYCTGGIRCERASEHLSNVLYNELKQFRETKTSSSDDNEQDNIVKDHPPEIYQLQGGIEKYLQAFKDTGGGYWRGKNFTFDKREAISVDNMNGDGGVLKVVSKKLKRTDGNGVVNTENTIANTEPGSRILECQCVLCQQYWDRYIGKKKCCTCGVPILVCDHCCSTKKEEIRTQAKCPLCIEEDITVPVTEVAYTNNGKQTKLILDPKANVDGSAIPKSSNTVLKWGGGHGSNRSSTTKRKRQCKFGSDCQRSDCIFDHPSI